MISRRKDSNTFLLAAALVAAAFVTGICSTTLYAGPIPAEMAADVVRGWLSDSNEQMETELGMIVTDVVPYFDDDLMPLYYIVYLEPQGYVIVSADNRIEPIIAFSPGYYYDDDVENPLAAMVNRDLSLRKEVIEENGDSLVFGACPNEEKWWEYVEKGEIVAKIPVYDQIVYASGRSSCHPAKTAWPLGARPASETSHPAADRPRTSAALSAGLERRWSQATTAPCGAKRANVPPMRAKSSSVRSRPNTPRMLFVRKT